MSTIRLLSFLELRPLLTVKSSNTTSILNRTYADSGSAKSSTPKPTTASATNPTSTSTTKPKAASTPKPAQTSAPKSTVTTAATQPTQTIPLTYQSEATPKPPNQPVGPGASKTGEYKNPEYYCFNENSFYDLESEMTKHRLPQPKADNEFY